jgi:hypothetical protein
MRKLRRSLGVETPRESKQEPGIDVRALILEGWRLSKGSKILWISSLGLGSASALSALQKALDLWANPSTVEVPALAWLEYACLRFLAMALLYSATLLFFYTLQFSSGGLALGKAAQSSEIWLSFKTNLWRWLLLGVISLAYFVLIVIFALLVFSVASILLPAIFTQVLGRRIVVIGTFVLLGAPVFLAAYGLLFRGLGAWASFRSGLGAFSKARTTFVLLMILGISPYLVINIAILISLLITRHAIAYEAYLLMWTALPISLLRPFLSALVFPVLYASFAVGYFRLAPPIVKPKS